MSERKGVIQGERLLGVAKVATELGRARSLPDLVASVGTGLEQLGMHVAVLSLEDGSYGVRYLTPTKGNNALHGLFTGSNPGRRWPQLEEVVKRASHAPILVPDEIGRAHV